MTRDTRKFSWEKGSQWLMSVLADARTAGQRLPAAKFPMLMSKTTRLG